MFGLGHRTLAELLCDDRHTAVGEDETDFHLFQRRGNRILPLKFLPIDFFHFYELDDTIFVVCLGECVCELHLH